MGKSLCIKTAVICLILLTINSCQLGQLIDSNQDSIKSIEISSKLKEHILNNIYASASNLKLCDGDIDKSLSQDSSSVYELNNREYLVEILCFLGAYQGNYQYFLYQIKDAQVEIKPLSFQQFIQDEENKIQLKNISSLAGSPVYDQDNQILTIVAKARGLADCGSFAQYQWKNSEFILLEYRIKEKCDGNYLPPENYPKIYP